VNLYIQKVWQEEGSIPLENIKAVSRYAAPKGGDFYRIRYTNANNTLASIWFYVDSFSEAIPKFIDDIKRLNSNVRFDI